MPRKKKKTNGHDLPPLQFIESPLDQSPHHPSSPDFGPVNPVTARLVAIEDLNDPNWVTPHFGSQSHVSSRCADQSSKRLTRLTRLRQKLECQKQDCTQDVTRKYKPLSFVNSREAALLSKRTALPSTVSQNASDNPARHTGTEERMGRKYSSDNQQTEMLVDSEEFPPNSFRISTPIIAGHRMRDGESSASPSPLCCPVMTDNTNGKDFKICHIAKEKPHDKIHEEAGCDGENEKLEPDDETDGLERSAVFCKKARRPMASLFGFSTPPPSPKSSPACDVLVADTPESEYGLTIRQRQLKYFLRSRRQQQR